MKKTIWNTIVIIRSEKSLMTSLLIFLIIPASISVIPFFFEVNLLQDVSGNFISGLSLFIGILFSLIITISDKIQTKKEELKAINEADGVNDSRITLLDAYIDFGKNTVIIISATVNLGLILIIFLLLNQFYFADIKHVFNTCWFIFCQILITYLSVVLLFLVWYILKSMYDFFYGQIGH